MKILTLERRRVPEITDLITQVARDFGLSNVFNPSVVSENGAWHATFRAAVGPGRKPFHAFLLHADVHGRTELTDLTALHDGADLTKVADPKLVVLNGDTYMTFNTGQVHSGHNDIYLQRVAPSLGPLQRCIYEQRRPVEKNWAFHTLPDGDLGVIYALAPFTALRLADGRLGVTDTLTFGAERAEPQFNGEFPGLHVGSQPLTTADGRTLLVANQRFRLPPPLYRRVYVGHLAEIDLSSSTLTRLSTRQLIHSRRSMFPPQRERHNPVLWSATYFSGLSRYGDDLLLGYGVNDKSFGVAQVSESSIWH